MLGGPGAPRFPVTKKRQLIGRSEHADITLLEPTISRKHASIRLNEGNVFLEDLGSKHGTFVNSKRITSCRLKVGDIVVFGLSLVLRLEESNRPLPKIAPMTSQHKTPSLVTFLETKTGVTDAVRGEVTASGKVIPDELSQAQTLPIEKVATRTKRSPIPSSFAVLLPHADARLRDLYNNLQQEVTQGIRKVDPHPILTTIEAVRIALTKMMDEIGIHSNMRSERTELQRAITRAIAAIGEDFLDRQIEFSSTDATGLKVLGDEYLLTKALERVLRFSGELSKERSLIEIIISPTKESILLTISHLGHAYPKDILETPLYGKDVRSRKQMGLEEVKEILVSFGGTIHIESNSGIGATVRIMLTRTIK